MFPTVPQVLFLEQRHPTRRSPGLGLSCPPGPLASGQLLRLSLDFHALAVFEECEDHSFCRRPLHRSRFYVSTRLNSDHVSGESRETGCPARRVLPAAAHHPHVPLRCGVCSAHLVKVTSATRPRHGGRVWGDASSSGGIPAFIELPVPSPFCGCLRESTDSSAGYHPWLLPLNDVAQVVPDLASGDHTQQALITWIVLILPSCFASLLLSDPVDGPTSPGGFSAPVLT